MAVTMILHENIRSFYRRLVESYKFMQRNLSGFDKNKWNATTATKQGILQESVEQRKITGGGMDRMLEIKMGAELERKKTRSDTQVTSCSMSVKRSYANLKDYDLRQLPPTRQGNYLPSGPDVEIDDSQYTYGPQKTQPSESESQTTEFDTCDSNISTESSELVSEPIVNESNVEVQPKVWSDAPIIEEYESDSDDEYVSVQTGPSSGLDTPSFANKQVKTRRENVKNQSTHSQKPKVNNKELGHGFNYKAQHVLSCGW
ncbi:hypothetical protein Tco_0282260 [Tanacetum coccineum]